MTNLMVSKEINCTFNFALHYFTFQPLLIFHTATYSSKRIYQFPLVSTVNQSSEDLAFGHKDYAAEAGGMDPESLGFSDLVFSCFWFLFLFLFSYKVTIP